MTLFSSIGFHYYETVNQSLQLQWLPKDRAPQVLGWKRAREIEAQYSLAPMQFALNKAIAAGEADVDSVEFTALLINAVLAEAALEAIHKQAGEPLEAQEAIVTKVIRAIVKAA